MALAKARGKVPAKSVKSPAAEARDTATSAPAPAVAKLTVSVKRRLSNGDEVFIAPGIEMHCAADDLDATQEAVTERVNGWMQNLLEAYPDPVGEDDDAEDTDDDEDADEEEADDDADDDADADEDEDEGLTEDQINAMSKKELVALIKEDELDVDTKLGIKELRAAVIEALSGDDDDDEDDEDADDDGEAEDDDNDDEDDDGEEAEDYTEAELKKMKLAELQEITKAWELPDPKIPKGSDLKTKQAAYVKVILKAQG